MPLSGGGKGEKRGDWGQDNLPIAVPEKTLIDGGTRRDSNQVRGDWGGKKSKAGGVRSKSYMMETK